MESPVARHVAAVEGACVARHEKPPDRQAKHRRWSVPRAIDEATAYLERYLLNCWQLLRNSHLSQYFPAIVIFRLVLRGVYVLLLAPLKKCDDSMYRWECAQRENMYEHEPTSSFGKLVYAVFVDRDGWASAFYADMLLEIIFMAAVCGANNASVKSRQRNRCQLRRWHWLVAAAASLFVAGARDARLTYWNHERPLDATAKSRSIVHVIGCAIILICDALLVAVLAYALVIAVAFAPHDAAEQAKRVEATRDRLAREKDPVERAVLEKALARDEALLADLKAEAPGALPRAWRPRADAWRALLRGTLRDPTWAPSHLYKEAEQRALLAALIHPAGACPGPFGGHHLAERAHDPTTYTPGVFNELHLRVLHPQWKYIGLLLYAVQTGEGHIDEDENLIETPIGEWDVSAAPDEFYISPACGAAAVTHMDANAKRIEQAKLRAIGMRNRVITERENRDQKRRALQALVAEREADLARVEAQVKSLRQVEAEQQNIIDKLAVGEAYGRVPVEGTEEGF